MDSTYEAEKYADIRIAHLASQDKERGWKFHIQPPYTWQNPDRPDQFRLPRGTVMTVGRGTELIAYAEDERRLYDAVTAAWASWRGQQAALGNLEEAAQEPPEELRELFEEPGGQLRLFPRDLP